VEVSPAQALSLRLSSLLLAGESGTGRRPVDVGGVATWFGAMQGQDLNSVLWSLGARLPSFTLGDVQAALERREAVRTWSQRGTIHLVPARDARWMVEHVGSRTLAGSAKRRAYLGITDQDATRAVDVLAAALSGGRRLTRSQCVKALDDAGIVAEGQRAYHLLWYASQLGVTCIAPNVGTEQTFVLLDEWVPDPHRPDREEALSTLARRYFASHGPTTRQDFAAWAGLTVADAKRGIASAGDALATVTVSGQDMVLASGSLPARSSEPAGRPDPEVLALPGFDEYLLGFKDRSLMLDPKHAPAICPGGNGVFRATIVRSGRVVATWGRAVSRGRTTVTVRPLVALGRSDRARTEAALTRFGAFTGSPLEDVVFDGSGVGTPRSG